MCLEGNQYDPRIFFFQNGLIELNDIEAFTEKLRSFAGWNKDSKEHRELIDVNSTFYECIRDQVRAEFQGKVKVIIHNRKLLALKIQLGSKFTL